MMYSLYLYSTKFNNAVKLKTEKFDLSRIVSALTPGTLIINHIEMKVTAELESWNI